jgi:hypothetical protein
VLGPDHPISLSAAAALSISLAQLGEVEAARGRGQDALQRCRRMLGPDHPITRYLTQTRSTDIAISACQPTPAGDATADRPDPPS